MLSIYLDTNVVVQCDFWLVEKLLELVDRLTGCGELARGGCLLGTSI